MKGRALLLPVAAIVAVVALLAVQLAFGGADFTPNKVANPCVERPLPPATTDLEAVTQSVVLLGVQQAACELGVSREQLVLALPSTADRAALAKQTGHTEAELAAALKAGMIHAVDRLAQADRLPPASALLDTYGAQLGLPPLAQNALTLVPDSVVDQLLPTGAVLERALQGINVDELLQGIDNPDALEPKLRAAIEAAALAEAKARVLEKLAASPFG